MTTAGSLFSGIGGFDLGFKRSGIETVWQVEICPSVSSVLSKHFPGVDRYEDIKTVGALPRVDVICAGFPCQDISVAGRRAGLDGERSELFFELMRIARTLRPRWVVIENVAGLLSSNGGRDMGTVVGALGQLGYRWAYRVLDSQYFGVAQRRRRVFIVGHLGDGADPAEVLFDGASLQRHPPTRREAGAQVAGTLEARAATGGYDPGALRDASKGSKSMPMVLNGRQDPINSEIALPLDTDPGSQAIFHCAPRRLMPVECERLQGFPDGWTEGLSDTARYRALGNAVTVSVAEWIGRRIIETEERYDHDDTNSPE